MVQIPEQTSNNNKFQSTRELGKFLRIMKGFVKLGDALYQTHMFGWRSHSKLVPFENEQFKGKLNLLNKGREQILIKGIKVRGCLGLGSPRSRH